MRKHWTVVLLIGIVVGLLLSASPSHAGRLYWTRNHGDLGGYLDNIVATSRTDGSDFRDLYLNVDNLLWSIAVDSTSRRLYWIESVVENSVIVRGDAFGCRRLQTEGWSSAIALDVTRGKIYWTEADYATSPSRIVRANLDLTSVELVLDGLSGGARTIGIDSPGGKIYWYAGLDGEIMRANLDGSDVEVQFAVSELRGMQVDSSGQKIYWADWSTGGFHRADFDGSNVEQLASQVKTPFVVDTSSGTVYWQAEDAVGPDWYGTIKRADLDGTNEAVVMSGPGAASSSLAFDQVDEAITINCDVPTPALGLRGAGVLALLMLGFGVWALRRS